MQEKTWSLYVLECQDGSYYTGISPDPQKRYESHCAGKGAAYTKTHPPKSLLVVEAVGTYSQALKREYQIKRLPKSGKIEFVADPSAFPAPSDDAKNCLTGRRPKRRKKKRKIKR